MSKILNSIAIRVRRRVEELMAEGVSKIYAALAPRSAGSAPPSSARRPATGAKTSLSEEQLNGYVSA